MNRLYPHPIIAREGWPFVAAALALALIVWLTAGGFVSFLFWVLFLLVLQFFRDPAREMTEDEDAVVSPVDGRVIRIVETTCPYTGEPSRMVSVFMNVFNVHSQKAPVAGTIESIEYFPGKFLNAALEKASSENERNAVTVRTPGGWRVCFVQVAGLVARRILCYRQIGDELARGERYGFIRFGSRVDVYLPLAARIEVDIGQKVTGVSTVIARLAPGKPGEHDAGQQ